MRLRRETNFLNAVRIETAYEESFIETFRALGHLRLFN
jgi:hypothetical protein